MVKSVQSYKTSHGAGMYYWGGVRQQGHGLREDAPVGQELAEQSVTGGERCS